MTTKSGRQPVVASAALVCLALAWPPTGQAQIEEITVTARKREESLQEVPLSVAAFTEEQLRQQGLTSDYDIADFTVNFNTLAQTGRDIDRPVIRGMGNPSTRGEPNASYFIDGTFVSSSISTATTSAVERVEILRGPQSAQFGRATFSGAINYVTKEPTNEFTGQLNTRAGTHDDYQIGGWLSGPIVADKLLFLVSADWSKYGGQWHNELEPDTGDPTDQNRVDALCASQDPWGRDLLSACVEPARFLVNAPLDGDHSRLGGEETKDLLAKMVWKPFDATEVTLKYSYTEGDDTHFPSLLAPELNCYLPTDPSQPWYRTSQGYFCGKFQADGGINRINLPDFRHGVVMPFASGAQVYPDDVTAAPAEPGTRRTDNRYLLDVIQELDGFKLTARGAYNKDEFQQVFDLDHTAARTLWGLFHFDNRREIRDWSTELRIETPSDLPVRGQLGVYYYDFHNRATQRSFVGPGVFFAAPLPGGAVTTTDFPPPTLRDTRNKAVFGGVDWDFAELWTLSLETRYAEDEKEIVGGNAQSGDLSFTNFTPRVTLRFKPFDELSAYILAAKGNKPGDFNTEFFRSDIDPAATQIALQEGGPCTLSKNDPLPIRLGGCALVKEEEAWQYEVGAKTVFFDRRLTANVAVFYTDWENQALFTPAEIPTTGGAAPLVTTILLNAGQSEVWGFEFESTLSVTDNLTLIGNYGYSDAEFVHGHDPTLAATTGVQTDANGQLVDNLAGLRIPNVPEHSAVLGVMARAPLTAESEAFFRTDVIWESDRVNSATNLSRIGNRTIVNLRAGVETESWVLTAYVRNLMDDNTPLAALDFVNFGAEPLANGLDARLFSLNPQRGRDWGVEFQYNFGAY